MNSEDHKIGYNFVPIPSFFFENGYFETDEEGKLSPLASLIFYIFRKCSPYPKTVFHDGEYIDLEPFEFIGGYGSISRDLKISKKTAIGLIKKLERLEKKSGHTEGHTKRNRFIFKRAHQRAHHFSIYTISREYFSKNEGTPKVRPPPKSQGIPTGTKQDVLSQDVLGQQTFEDPNLVMSFRKKMEEIGVSKYFAEKQLKNPIKFKRIQPALDYVNSLKASDIDTTKAQIFNWHTQQENIIPPKGKTLTKQQEYALEFNKKLIAAGHKEAQKNDVTIMEFILHVPMGNGIWTTISLKNSEKQVLIDIGEASRFLPKRIPEYVS